MSTIDDVPSCGQENDFRRASRQKQSQQLVARIKRSSKYYGQTGPGEWFDVRVVHDMGYGLRGNHNNYRFCDVVFGIRLEDGAVVELSPKRGRKRS
jgi:hypothetical protein